MGEQNLVERDRLSEELSYSYSYKRISKSDQLDSYSWDGGRSLLPKKEGSPDNFIDGRNVSINLIHQKNMSMSQGEENIFSLHAFFAHTLQTWLLCGQGKSKFISFHQMSPGSSSSLILCIQELHMKCGSVKPSTSRDLGTQKIGTFCRFPVSGGRGGRFRSPRISG